MGKAMKARLIFPPLRLLIAISVITVANVGLMAAAETIREAQNRLTQAERTLCAGLGQCRDIVKQHGTDSFDYVVLADAFRRFGPQGQQAMITLALSHDASLSERGFELLRHGHIALSAEQAHKIINAWPSANPKLHGVLLLRQASPSVQSRLIQTLQHPDAQIRDLSYVILERLYHKDRQYVPHPDDHAALIGAAKTRPSAALTSLVARLPRQKAWPLLEDILRLGDVDAARLAYAQLRRWDETRAFQALSKRSLTLQPEQYDAARTLAIIMAQSAQNDSDKPYAALIKSALTGPGLNASVRLFGFEAYMRGPFNTGILDGLDPAMLQAAARLSAQDKSAKPAIFWQRLQALPADIRRPLWSLFWPIVQRHGDAQIFLTALAQTQDPARLPIFKAVLEDNSDFQRQVLTANWVHQYNIAALKPLLARFAHIHPIQAVRASAEGSSRAMSFAPSCPVKALDLMKITQQMPFFETGTLPAVQAEDENARYLLTERPALRLYLTAAQPSPQGWLAGYDAGSKGGALIYYRNQTHAARRLLDGQVHAIVSVKPARLGHYEQDFWVIATPLSRLGDADKFLPALYRVKLDLAEPIIEPYMKLPGVPSAIGRPEPGLMIVAFDDYQGPIAITPNGQMRKACQ